MRNTFFIPMPLCLLMVTCTNDPTGVGSFAVYFMNLERDQLSLGMLLAGAAAAHDDNQ